MRKSMLAGLAAIATASSVLLPSGAAFAQRYDGYYGHRYYEDQYDRQYAWGGGERRLNPYPYQGPSDRYGYPSNSPNACIKLCPQDNNPCDPIQYKQADNRCRIW